MGIWDKSVYYQLESAISKVKSLFIEADKTLHYGENHGFVEASQFFSFMKKSAIWSKKTVSNLKALEQSLYGNTIDEIFSNDGSFVNTILLQELETSQAKLLSIQTSFKSGTITFQETRELFQKTYTNKSQQEIQILLLGAFGGDKGEKSTIQRADLIKNLSRYI